MTKERHRFSYLINWIQHIKITPQISMKFLIEHWKTHDRDLENDEVMLRCCSCCPCKSWVGKILKPSFFLGFDYCSHFNLHGSVFPLICLFLPLSSLCCPLHFLGPSLPSLSEFLFKTFLPERSCTASTDLPGGFSAFSCSFIFCLFPCFSLICRTPSVTMAMLIITPLLDLWQHKQMDGWLGMSNALLLHANKCNLWRGSTNQRDINTSKPMLFPSVFRSHITGGATQLNARVTLRVNSWFVRLSVKRCACVSFAPPVW